MKLTLTWSGGASAGAASSRASTFLTTAAVVVTLLTPVASAVLFFLAGSANVPANILAVYVCLLTGVLLILLIKQEHHHDAQIAEQQQRHKDQLEQQEKRHHQQLMEQEVRSGREIRYASATTPLRKAFGCLANASWTMLEDGGSEEAFTEHVRNSLLFLAEAFSHITDQPCRASIKMTSWPNHGARISDVRVYTLCRSDDEVRENTSTYDQIGNNTDFKKIFEDDTAYFLCNDLPSEIGKGYQNSHWDTATIQSQAFRYRATIVWPISRARARMTPQSHEREVIGFLCVDTMSINSFNETYDVPIGMAFAGGLHLALNRFRARRATTDGSNSAWSH